MRYAPIVLAMLLASLFACEADSTKEEAPATTAAAPAKPPPAPEPEPAPKPGPKTTFETRGGDKREMTLIPAGPFLRGSPDGEGRDEEHPQKTITLDAFWIDRTEVTVADFAACVAKGACKAATFRKGTPDPKAKKPESCNFGMPDRDKHPMNCVNWDGASAYCAWAGKRLPTEAEWEKAARGGDGRKYPWGEEAPSCERACMVKGMSYGCGARISCPVGTRTAGASPYGALDMAGNVYEWVKDSYNRGYYAKAPDANPINTERTPFRPVRGGAYSSDADGVRATQRSSFKKDERISFVGFRCAMAP